MELKNEVPLNKYVLRREFVFLLIAGLFLGSLALLNVLGITRFIDLSKYFGISDESPLRFSIAVGVLAYPLTFLCTDIISEIYGKRRANMLVWIGLILNVWVLIILYLGGALNPPANLDANGLLPIDVINGKAVVPYGYSFYQVRFYTFGAVTASMLSYLLAQFIDVQLFHYLKKKTSGKKLWLRNNGSTLVSQFVDSVTVIIITHFYAHALPIDVSRSLTSQLWMFILSSYIFKFVFALLDTFPFYWSVKFLKKYLGMDKGVEELGAIQ